MKIAKYIAYSVTLISILCMYSWMVYHVSTGGTKLNPIKQPLLKFAAFPQHVQKILSSPEVTNIPESYLPADENFVPVNHLTYDLFGLNSFWNNATDQWEMKLFNFKDDAVIHTWYYTKSNYVKNRRQFPNCPPKHLALLPDKGLLGRLTQSPNLFRMDSSSNIIWHNQEMEYHHALNFDADSNVWACASNILNEDVFTGGLVKNLDDQLVSYSENFIVKVDIETGEILIKKGVGQILLDNHLDGVLYSGEMYDPLHINDIQPALSDTKFWQKGDLFISIRNKSLIIHYRPSNNKVIELIRGPFLNQHDVTILSDHEISIFNNNYISNHGFDTKDDYMEADSLNASEILVYNFEDQTYSKLLEKQFLVEKIMSYGQGLAGPISNGDWFVEEHNSGVHYVINEDEIVLKKVFYTADSTYIFLPNWMRTYEELPFTSKYSPK
ncbi:MAG: arylsulfotransferase family protein [Chitinophagales bacterium]